MLAGHREQCQVPPYDSDGQATDRTSEMMNVALPKERAARTTVVAARQAGWAWTSGGAAALQGAGAEAPARPPPEKTTQAMLHERTHAPVATQASGSVDSHRVSRGTRASVPIMLMHA